MHMQKSDKEIHEPGAFRILLRLLIPVLVLVGSACTSPIDASKRTFGASSSRVLGIAYQHIRERYIETVPMQEVALGGMKGISAIDPEFDVTSAGSSVPLVHQSR